MTQRGKLNPCGWCDWCDLPTPNAVSLFANGRGWTKVCEECLDMIEPVRADPARKPPRHDGLVTHA